MHETNINKYARQWISVNHFLNILLGIYPLSADLDYMKWNVHWLFKSIVCSQTLLLPWTMTFVVSSFARILTTEGWKPECKAVWSFRHTQIFWLDNLCNRHQKSSRCWTAELTLTFMSAFIKCHLPIVFQTGIFTGTPLFALS